MCIRDSLYLGQFGLNAGNVVLHLVDIHQFLLLKGIHIPGDVEVEVIFLDFLKRRYMAELVHILPCLVGVDDAGNIAVAQNVLVLALLRCV